MAGEVNIRMATPTVAESASNNSIPSKVDDKSVSTTTVSPPFMDYESQVGAPFTVSYFNLGDRWADPNGGFPKEIGIIEGYFSDKINSGEIPNSTEVVKRELKSILKLTNMDKEERDLVKVETVAAYIKFLSEKEDIQRNIRRYGSTR